MKQFREQAIQLVLEQELTTPEATRRLAMVEPTLANGVSRLKREIAKYMDDFYTRQRRRSRPGHRSPAAVVQQGARQQPAA